MPPRNQRRRYFTSLTQTISMDESLETRKKMKEELHEIAEKGDIQRLHELIQTDRTILDGEADTALHIAARNGKAIFAAEVAIFNPLLTRKLNPQGLTPLHEALKHQKWKTATALTALDVELIRVKGSGGKTALHVAAEIAPPRLLAEFLYLCPASLEDITSRRETAVHRALKKKNILNFMVLFKWIFIVRKEFVLEWKDFRGNTALHVAAHKWKDVTDAEGWKKVLKKVVLYVPRETTNFSGQTAAQLLVSKQPESRDDKEVRRQLTQFNILNLWHEVDNCLKRHFLKTTLIDNLERQRWFEKCLRYLGFPEVRTPAGEKSRDVVLVVATLIATATYQAILTPPGGYWQEDSVPPAGSTAASPPPHAAGQLIMHGMTLLSFTATNAVAFCFALAAIVLNVAQLKQAVLLMVATYVVLFNYMSNIILAILMGKNRHWKLLKPSTWEFYPEFILPAILLLISLVYAITGSYVAINNKYVHEMDSSAQRNIPVLGGKNDPHDHKKSDDDPSDDDDEESKD